MNPNQSRFVVAALVAFFLFFLFGQLSGNAPANGTPIAYSDFLNQVKAKEVR